MFKVTFKLDSALAYLGGLFDTLTRPEKILQPAAEVVARAIERNFEEEGRPEPWKPLTPKYARYKSRRWPGTKILERAGALRGSIRVTAVPGPGNTAAIVASTDVFYAPFHQFGVRSNNLPPRPFLVLTGEDREEAARVIAHELLKVDR